MDPVVGKIRFQFSFFYGQNTKMKEKDKKRRNAIFFFKKIFFQYFPFCFVFWSMKIIDLKWNFTTIYGVYTSKIIWLEYNIYGSNSTRSNIVDIYLAVLTKEYFVAFLLWQIFYDRYEFTGCKNKKKVFWCWPGIPVSGVPFYLRTLTKIKSSVVSKSDSAKNVQFNKMLSYGP